MQALYVGSTLHLSVEQRHDVISTTFQRPTSNVRCPLGKELKSTEYKGLYVSNEFLSTHEDFQ